jgi:hypothetical protein
LIGIGARPTLDDMFAPGDKDDPEPIWPRRRSRRREWRNLGLTAAVWATVALATARLGWELLARLVG